MDVSKTPWQNFLYYIWLPFSIFMTAVDLIQIGEIFWPTIIKWLDFIDFFIQKIKVFRDLIFGQLHWLNINFDSFTKDYILLGAFISNCAFTGQYLYKKQIQKDTILDEIIKEFKDNKFPRVTLALILGVLLLISLWPLLLILMIFVFLFDRQPIAISNDENYNFYEEYSISLKLIFRVIIMAGFIVLINYLFADIKFQ